MTRDPLALLEAAERRWASYWGRLRAAALAAPIFRPLDSDEYAAVYGSGFFQRYEPKRPFRIFSEVLPVEDDYSEESYP